VSFHNRTVFSPGERVSELFELRCFADYHWPSVRDFLAKRTLDKLEQVGELTYARNIPEGVLVAEYVPQENKFLIKLLAEKPITAIEQFTHYRENMVRVLGCLTPWSEVNSALTAAGVPAQRIHHGLSIAGVWSPFEALLRAICGQQVSVGAAVTQANRVVELALQTQGTVAQPQITVQTQTKIGAQNQTTLVADELISTTAGLPSVDVFVSTDFSSLKMPERRKQTLIDSIAWWQQHMPESTLSLQTESTSELNAISDSNSTIESPHALSSATLHVGSQSEALESLLAVKGIGPWTINYIRLRGFAETDVMLDNDLIVRQQLTKHDLDTNAAKPWRSYLCLLLWEWSTLEKLQKKDSK